MVVLETKNPNMSSSGSGNNSYYKPEYIQPSPYEYKMEKSPLEMLAQTCNAIGSDMPISEKMPRKQSERPKSLSPLQKLSPRIQPSPSSSTSSLSSPRLKIVTASPEASPTESAARAVPPSKSIVTRGPPASTPPNPRSQTSPRVSTTTPSSPRSQSSPRASGHPKAHQLGLPFLAGLSPPTMSLSPGGGVCTDPLCRDPTCPTFQLRQIQAAQQSHLLAGYPPHLLPGGGPSLYPSPFASLLPHPPPPLGNPPAASPTSASPYMCSWMQGRDFCGRRFATGEDLMSHLRTHTNLTAHDPAAKSPPGSERPPSIAGSSLAALAEARFHPYSGPAHPRLSALPPPMLPPLPPALNPAFLSNPSLLPFLTSPYGLPRFDSPIPGLP